MLDLGDSGFFFSSRRRHTRYWRDWSSDVCSSDLGALTLAGSAWLFVALRTNRVDGWVAPDTGAPLGPLEALLPLYGTDSLGELVATSLVVAALAGLAFWEWRSWRQTAGITRRAYSP